jgi:hypothetical protein
MAPEAQTQTKGKQINKTAFVHTECAPELKEAFLTWLKNNGFATPSEAIRDYMRKVTNFDSESQEKSP